MISFRFHLQLISGLTLFLAACNNLIKANPIGQPNQSRSLQSYKMGYIDDVKFYELVYHFVEKTQNFDPKVHGLNIERLAYFTHVFMAWRESADPKISAGAFLHNLGYVQLACGDSNKGTERHICDWTRMHIDDKTAQSICIYRLHNNANHAATL